MEKKYIGGTGRKAPTRFVEHIFHKLYLRGSKVFTSAIIKQLMDSGHNVDTSKAFEILNRQCTPRSFRFKETIVIKRFRSGHCIEKESVM